jgi:hypothetical protein
MAGSFVDGAKEALHSGTQRVGGLVLWMFLICLSFALAY